VEAWFSAAHPLSASRGGEGEWGWRRGVWLLLPGRPWWRGGGGLSLTAPLCASPVGAVFVVVAFFPLASFDSSVESGLWLLRWARWSSPFLELLLGGLRRLASVSPSGLNWCRAPLCLLRCSAGFCSPCRSKWPCSSAVAWCPVRSDAVGGLVEARGPDRVLRFVWGPFYTFSDRVVIPLFLRVCL
jgi:hypothetical protein